MALDCELERYRLQCEAEIELKRMELKRMELERQLEKRKMEFEIEMMQKNIELDAQLEQRKVQFEEELQEERIRRGSGCPFNDMNSVAAQVTDVSEELPRFNDHRG